MKYLLFLLLFVACGTTTGPDEVMIVLYHKNGGEVKYYADRHFVSICQHEKCNDTIMVEDGAKLTARWERAGNSIRYYDTTAHAGLVWGIY